MEYFIWFRRIKMNDLLKDIDAIILKYKNILKKIEYTEIIWEWFTIKWEDIKRKWDVIQKGNIVKWIVLEYEVNWKFYKWCYYIWEECCWTNIFESGTFFFNYEDCKNYIIKDYNDKIEYSKNRIEKIKLNIEYLEELKELLNYKK